MQRYIDIENWSRKELFHFFRKYDRPFFNICADVEVTDCLRFARKNSLSFFIASLYLSTRSANEVEAFRYRLRGEQIIVHEVIHAGSTVLNSDESFGFCYFDFFQEFGKFNRAASEQLLRNASGFKRLEPNEGRDDLIHYSVIPWISFTSFSHARNTKDQDSIPKIVFGKYHDNAGRTKMPVSVEVHHALMDGIHVGKFFRQFQNHLSQPEKSLK